MALEDNKLVARQLQAALGGGNAEKVMELTTPDYVCHFSGLPGPIHREEYIMFNQAVRASFADFRFKIEDIIAEGDRVALRITAQGTHTRKFQGIDPTGIRFEISGMAIRRLEGGKVAEEWVTNDQLGLMRQLGGFPVRP